MNLGALLNR